jgi:arsenate reductase (thioredoxin)
MNKKTVLFLCTHNSARSVMAEGLLNRFHGDRYLAHSAGTEPRDVNPFTVRVMAEIGINVAAHRPMRVGDFHDQPIDLVVTVCDGARESCPIFRGAGETRHESFPDPSAVTGSDGEKLAAFRAVRDAIRAWIEKEFT